MPSVEVVATFMTPSPVVSVGSSLSDKPATLAEPRGSCVSPFETKKTKISDII